MTDFNGQSPLGAAPAQQPPQRQYLQFHAGGSEYFRIWIVNLLLTIITFGIYSAWAKVRRNQYFYASTALAGSSFEYHGNPVAILKGRVIAGVVVGLYAFAGNISPVFALVMAVVMAAALPWFIWRSLQFQMYNSAYRGIRFRFVGQLRDAYVNVLLRPLLNIVTFGLATPYIHQRLKAWQFNEGRFGGARFSLLAGAGAFYRLYAIFFVASIAMIVAFFVFFASKFGAVARNANPLETIGQVGSGLVGMALFYVILLSLAPLFLALVQNLVWNNACLDQHRFRSEVMWGRMLFIIVTNYIGVVCTLGLFLPFAQVRLMRYRIESLSVMPQGSFDDIVADAGASVGATGEGVADFMDLDFSL